MFSFFFFSSLVDVLNFYCVVTFGMMEHSWIFGDLRNIYTAWKDGILFLHAGKELGFRGYVSASGSNKLEYLERRLLPSRFGSDEVVLAWCYRAQFSWLIRLWKAPKPWNNSYALWFFLQAILWQHAELYLSGKNFTCTCVHISGYSCVQNYVMHASSSLFYRIGYIGLFLYDVSLKG